MPKWHMAHTLFTLYTVHSLLWSSFACAVRFSLHLFLFLLEGVALQDDLLLPSLVAYLLVADRGQHLPICRCLCHSSAGSRGLLLCAGTLELEPVASTRARPYPRFCADDRRVRGLEEGRTADGAASREYDGRRARAMGIGPPFELASSSPPFATMQIASKSAFGSTGVGTKLLLLLSESTLVSLLVPFDLDTSCSAASPISVKFSTCGAI